MKQHRVPSFICLALLFVIVSACASPISKEVREEADENLEFIKVLENPMSFRGVVVIWGGIIMRVENHSDESKLFLWETPLDFRGRPKGREYSEGEFVAKTSQFLDPQMFARGRKVTLAGEIIGEELGSYDKLPYVYPVIKIRESRLWKKEIPSIQWDWGETPYYWPDEISPDEERQRALQ